jgi:hypothetical protein
VISGPSSKRLASKGGFACDTLILPIRSVLSMGVKIAVPPVLS